MTRPSGTLERSLRDGPPDEVGYRPRLETSPALATADPTRIVPLERIRARPSLRRSAVTPAWQAIAAALVVAVGLAGLAMSGLGPRIGGPGPTSPAPESASPSLEPPTGSPVSTIVVPPLTEAFVSPRHGFSLRYPAGWTVRPATVAWLPNTFLPYGNPALDTLELAGEARLIVASQPLGDGQTEAAWLAAFFRPYEGDAPCGGDSSTWPRLAVDGRVAYLDAADCPVPLDMRIAERDVSFEVLVFAGGRVYEIGLDGDVDRAYFEAILATVRLDPAAAAE
jgi:hypothetical protein